MSFRQRHAHSHIDTLMHKHTHVRASQHTKGWVVPDLDECQSIVWVWRVHPTLGGRMETAHFEALCVWRAQIASIITQLRNCCLQGSQRTRDHPNFTADTTRTKVPFVCTKCTQQHISICLKCRRARNVYGHRCEPTTKGPNRKSPCTCGALTVHYRSTSKHCLKRRN